MEENKTKFKQCSDCKESKELTEFYSQKVFRKRTNDYRIAYKPFCKPCGIKRQQKRYQEDPEYGKEQSRQQRLRDHEGMNEKKRKWTEENKQHVYEYTKEYQQEHPEKMKQYGQNREHKNHDISNKEWLECKTYFNNSCAYCGLTYDQHKIIHRQDLHKEHAIFNGANDLSNCIPSCKSCNGTKWEYDYTEWYSEDNPNFTQEKCNKIVQWLTDDYKLYMEEKLPYKIKQSRVYNDDRAYKYQFELWAVDENRNLTELLATKPKKKDLKEDIHKHFPEIS